MEDLLYYIGLGAIIVISLVRKAGKIGKSATRKVSKQNNTPESAPIPGFPTFESVTYELKRVEPDKNNKSVTIKMETNRPVEAQSLETIIDEEEEYMKKMCHKAPKPNVGEAGKSAQAKPAIGKEVHKAPKSHKTAQNSRNSAISKEFDLRDAVIYSEIMNPKFNE